MVGAWRVWETGESPILLSVYGYLGNCGVLVIETERITSAHPLVLIMTAQPVPVVIPLLSSAHTLTGS